ncbi:MAG TPA: hypothetical protein PKY60_10995 [Thermoflexales bacterium]|nr:hypothetical protein [Thermoflexales bacterium]
MNILTQNNNGSGTSGQAGHAIFSTAVLVAFVAFCSAMSYAVWKLGVFYQQPEAYCWLTAGGCALGVVGHGAAATRREGTNTGRMMHGISLGTWLILSVFLAAVYMATSSKELSAELPAEMVSIGRWVYSLAFGIGLFTSTLALVVPSAAANPLADGSHATIGAALSKFGEPVVIILAIAASSLHLFSFGQNVARLDLFSIVAAMVIADLAFLVAEKKTISEMKARREVGRYDRFDLVMWGVFGLMVLAYLVLVNIYAVRFTSNTLNMNDPTLHSVIDFYAASPSILILCLAALALITALVDAPAGQAAQAGAEDGVTILSPPAKPVLARLAGQINRQRDGLGELRAAVSRKPALAAPEMTVQMTAQRAAISDVEVLPPTAAEVAGGPSKS